MANQQGPVDRATPAGDAALAPATSANPLIGIGCVLLATCLVPASDTLVKILTGHIPVLEVLWLRYLSQTLVLLPIVLWIYGARAFRSVNPKMQLIRSGLIAVTALQFFTAVSLEPLADVVAVFFVSPFVVTALSPLLLGERVGIWRWSAVVTGFLGALIIIRPGFEAVGPGTLAALGAGITFALFIIATRRMAGGDPALVTAFLTGLGVAIIAALSLPFVWVTPGVADLPLILGMGVFGSAFGVLIVIAYQHASASELAPYGYVEIAAAALIGWMVFGDLPDAMTWIGIGVIVASGLVIAWRETIRGSVRRVGALRKTPLR
ncbi:MAG: DMT family transporter [Pseudomonadota bacterium]